MLPQSSRAGEASLAVLVAFNNRICCTYMVSHQGNPKTIASDISLPARSVPVSFRFHNLANGAGRFGCRIS